VSVPRPVTSVRALKVRPDSQAELPEHVATEEPMQILVAGRGQATVPLAVTMRTPGHDFELAAGFVVTEGVATGPEIVSVDYCEAVDRSEPSARYNHVSVRLDRPWAPEAPTRFFTASASCGTCGKASINQIELHCPPVPRGRPVAAELISTLPELLREAQKAFDRTGGLHAAGLFDRSGELHAAREDVGRHNAVDKVVGATVLAGHPQERHEMILAVSGRVSFEIVQKAAVAGIGLVAAVSAPSSLAVSAALSLGVTVAAFVRGQTYNVYSHPERIAFGS
jgi:FdhD protein